MGIVPIYVRDLGQSFIAECPLLDISGEGRTREEAVNGVYERVVQKAEDIINGLEGTVVALAGHIRGVSSLSGYSTAYDRNAAAREVLDYRRNIANAFNIQYEQKVQQERRHPIAGKGL